MPYTDLGKRAILSRVKMCGSSHFSYFLSKEVRFNKNKKSALDKMPSDKKENCQYFALT